MADHLSYSERYSIRRAENDKNLHIGSVLSSLERTPTSSTSRLERGGHISLIVAVTMEVSSVIVAYFSNVNFYK